MASAIIGGALGSGFLTAESIAVSDANPQTTAALTQKFGVAALGDNRDVAARSWLIVLAVKPQFYGEVIEQVKDEAMDGGQKIVMTLAPGWTLDRTQAAFGGPLKVVRTMPNTPALVGQGVTGFCISENMTPGEAQWVTSLLESFGRAELLPERLMDTFVGLCGSSPAFVFMMIEALADAAVHQGFPRAQAYPLAAQAVLGSAQMVLELGQHPAQLKDMVCSPGGSTIEGVRVLEEKGMRSAFFEAALRTIAKAKEL
ncbi:MAG: pyrroline-5-carboxylate reductase [Oscillospiraceae bacterium]|nr:pyrroline-5-carboxylate reductase [Oscillospiraceae bacterium]